MHDSSEIVIKITKDDLEYVSDFAESETLFWLEAVKNIILQSSFLAERQ